MPIRIQRRRTKGWRMPAGAVYVGRPSYFGNPFSVEMCGLTANAPLNRLTSFITSHQSFSATRRPKVRGAANWPETLTRVCGVLKATRLVA